MIKNGLKKISNMSQTVKATIAFGFASFAINGINYLTTPIFTRLLSTSDFGVISVYNTWLAIIQVIATMTLIYPGVLHVGLYEHAANRWTYLSKMLGIITSSSLFLAFLYIAFHSKANAFIRLGDSLMGLILLVCIFTAATSLWTTKQRYEYNYKITITVTIGTALLAQIVSIIAVVLMRQHSDVSLVQVRLWSAGAVNIVVGTVLYVYILYKGKEFVDIPLWKHTTAVAIPLIPHYLSWVVLHGADKIMISQMVGNDKAGIYSLAATLSSIGILFWRALSTTFAPFVNTNLGKRNFKEIDEVIKPLLIIVCITCFIGALAAPEIIRILATKDYLAGIFVIPPVVIGIYFLALYEVFASVAFFHKESMRIMIASVVSAIVNVVLNYICIKKFGYIAAGYTTLIANVLLVSMHYYNMRKIEPCKIFDSRFILCSIIGLSALCLSCNVLYQLNNAVRYCLIIIAIIFLMRQKDSTIKAINKMKVE